MGVSPLRPAAASGQSLLPSLLHKRDEQVDALFQGLAPAQASYDHDRSYSTFSQRQCLFDLHKLAVTIGTHWWL